MQGLVQGAWTTPQPTYYGSFNGSSQTIYASANSLNIRTNSFTMEGYFYANTLNQNGGLFGASFPAFYVQINTAGRIFVSDGVTDIINALYGNAFQSQAWTHIAVSFDGTTYRLFFNGVLLASSTTLLASNTLTNLYIGESPSNGLYFNGLVSNFRFVKGTALYTANFAPPTGPLTAVANTSLLTLQNATIVDNSTNAFSITNTGSVTTTQSNLVFPNSQKIPAVEYLVVAGGGGAGGAGGGGGGLLQGLLPIITGQSYTVTVGSGGNGGANESTTPATQGGNSLLGSITAIGGGKGGTWYSSSQNAVALGGSGGSGGGSAGQYTYSSYVAGAQATGGQGNAGGSTIGSTGTPYYQAGGGGAGTVGLNANPSTNAGNGGAGIASSISGTVTAYAGGGGGGRASGGTDANVGQGGAGGGGSAATTSSGTPSSGSTNSGGGGGGTNGAATGGNGGSGIVIISYPDTYNAPSALTGTYTASTSGSGSLSFNGSSQYLTWPSGSSVAFGTGDFTVECWVYLTSSPTINFIVDFRDASHTTAPTFVWGDQTSGVLYWNNGSTTLGSSATWNTNTWYHVAYVRSGTTGTIYQNGVAIGTGSDSTNYSVTPTTSSIAARYASTFYYFPGYISNLRIVKGTAVYTSTFTPSTKPLTAITNTTLLLNTVSGAQFADSSSTSATITATGSPTWNQLSPFATGLGYKNRVYTWTSSGTVTF